GNRGARRERDPSLAELADRGLGFFDRGQRPSHIESRLLRTEARGLGRVFDDDPHRPVAGDECKSLPLDRGDVGSKGQLVGAPRGAASTHQLPPTNCGNPASSVVGTSGSSAMRWRAMTASTLSLPAFTGPMIPVKVGKATWMSPASSAWTMGGVPLYGTYTMEFPVCCENAAPVRCAGE